MRNSAFLQSHAYSNPDEHMVLLNLTIPKISMQIRPKLGRVLKQLQSVRHRTEGGGAEADSYKRTGTGETLSKIFTFVVAIVVLFNTFMMGTQLDIKIIAKVVKKPIGPAIGLCMPVRDHAIGIISLPILPIIFLINVTC